MNRNIPVYKAINYIIGVLAFIILVSIWPLNLVHRTDVSKSADNVSIVGSEICSSEHIIAQVFVSKGNILKSIDVYVCSSYMQDRDISLTIYDGTLSQIYSKTMTIDSNQSLPGFVRVPIRLDIDRGAAYIFSVAGVNDEMIVGLEDHNSTSNPDIFAITYDGMEDPDHNIVATYNYGIKFNWWQVLLSYIITILMAAGLIVVNTKFAAPKLRDREIKVQRLLQYTCNPIIAAVTIYGLWLVFPKMTFSDKPINFVFWYAGILITAGWLIYEVNYKRTVDKPFISLDFIKSHIQGWLTAFSLAMMLWYCFEYMNGLYNIHHAYACRRILIWFLVAVITTYNKKEICNISNAIWAVIGVPLMYFYAKPYEGMVEEELLYKLNAYIIYVGIFVIINIVYSIIRLVRRDIKLPKVRLIVAIPFVIFIVGICILANTRQWPGYMALIVALLIFRLGVWECADRWVQYLCDGIIINFIFMMVFSLLHRPYYGYMLHRYDMCYMTVTMTATHLTLCLAAIGAKVYVKNKTCDDKRELIPWLVIFGIIANYQIFTLSRTGYLAVVVMAVVALVVISIYASKKGTKIYTFFAYTLVLLASVLVMFAPTSTITRMIPPLVDDPVIYEYEPCLVTGYKGTAPDYEYYMDLPRFIDVFMSKVLGLGDTITDAGDMEIPEYEYNPRYNLLYASAGDVSIDEAALEDDGDDVSNGRIDIYKSYLSQLNIWGHDEMGATLQDGEIATHAHDIYLQVMYDHGIVYGIYFTLFMIFITIITLVDYIKSDDKGDYTVFKFILMVGFTVAGLVEWIFHPCNPFGLSVVLVITSMVWSIANKKRI